MKLNNSTIILGMTVALVTLGQVGLAATDEPVTAENRTSSGTLSAVNAANRTITLKQFLRSRRFNLGQDCTVAVRGQATASVAELKPGMQVKVTYQNVDGVFVANRVAQRQYSETGSIKTIDAADRTLSLDRPGADHTFKVPENCRVIINDEPSSNWDSLKVGERITVRYVDEKGERIANQIVSAHDTRIGTIVAIDTVANTIKIERLLSTEQFSLADRCKVVVNGNPEARLKDLHLGEKVAIEYREANGVLIATRIAPAESRARGTSSNSSPSNH